MRKRPVQVVWEKADRSRRVSPAPWFVPNWLQPVERILPWYFVLPFRRIGKWSLYLSVTYFVAWVRFPLYTAAFTLLGIAVGVAWVQKIRAESEYQKTIVTPLRQALAPILDAPVSDTKWLTVPADLDSDEDADEGPEVRIQLPPAFAASDDQRTAVNGIVTRRLGSLEADWRYSELVVCFRRPPPPPTLVNYDATVSQKSHIWAPAQGARGKWILIDFNIYPHVLICAPTGWGKTVTLDSLISHVSSFGESVDIIDPKRIGFLHFKGIPNIRIHTDIKSQLETLHAFRVEMERRYVLMENGDETVDPAGPKWDRRKYPRRYLAIDEMGSFMQMMLEFWRETKERGEPNRPPWVGDYLYILWQGRAAGCHLVVGAHQASADVLINSDARNQFGAKILAGPQSDESWRMAYGRGTPKMRTAARKGSAAIGIGETLHKGQLVRIEKADAVELARKGTPTNVPREQGKAPLPADMPANVPPSADEDGWIVGNEAGAAFLGMSPDSFRRARTRAPVEGEQRRGRHPAWTEQALVSWQSKRPRAGRTLPNETQEGDAA
jgi:hypothetical protein